MMKSKKKTLEKLAKQTEVATSKKVKFTKEESDDSDFEEIKINPKRDMQEEESEGEDGPQYEDAFDDEFETEDVINKDEPADQDEWEDDGSFIEEEEESEEEPPHKPKKNKQPKEETKTNPKEASNGKKSKKQQEELTNMMSNLNFSDVPVILEQPDNPKSNKKKKKENEVKAFTGTTKTLAKGEKLEFDNRAYDMFHRATTEWPCLSYDFLNPSAAYEMEDPKDKSLPYPLTLYLVAGTQADHANKNAIYVMKWSQLCKTRNDDDSVVFDSEDEDGDMEPELAMLSIKQNSCINRIKTMNNSPIVALWNENAEVAIYNVSAQLESLMKYEEDEETGKKPALFTPKDSKNNFLIRSFKQLTEGFALEWNPFNNGIFLSGSNDKKICVYRPTNENYSDWAKDVHPFMYHQGSVEDIVFSPKDEAIFASCSSDKTVCVMDMRSNNRNKADIRIEAHDCDVNVLCWNAVNTNLIVSGADDGSFKVWDIRYWKEAEPAFEMAWHSEAITSIHYQPGQDSVLVVSSEDNRTSVWDLAMEAEDQNEKSDFPDQLLFLHQGQEEVKEVKFHPRYHDLIANTSISGFNVFKPNVDVEDDEDL